MDSDILDDKFNTLSSEFNIKDIKKLNDDLKLNIYFLNENNVTII